jgi:autotransporter adhesin
VSTAKSSVTSLSTSVDTRFANLGLGGPQPSGGANFGAGSFAGTGAAAFGYGAYASGNGDTAVGTNAHVGADNGTAVGANSHIDAAASNATAIGAGASIGPNGSHAVAIGENASANAPNAVAIGSNSVANQPNTVSFGSPGYERRLTNIAPGVYNTDAANYGQVRRAYGGVAMAFAMTSVQPSLAPREQAVSLGVGTYQWQQGFSLRYEARPTDKVFVGAGVAVSGDGAVGGSAGIGFKW